MRIFTCMRTFFFICLFILTNFGLFGQSEQLAKKFMEKGEYEKALNIYQKLSEENPLNPIFFDGKVAAYQQLENFEAAEKLLKEKLNNTANNPAVLIDLGHNYELQQQQENAGKYYEEALRVIEGRPNYAYGIAKSFEKYSLLEWARRAYERAMKLSGDKKYSLQLARIYGEQGNVEKMFSNYLDLVAQEPRFLEYAKREFGRYLSKDAEDEENSIFRKLLLSKLRNNPQLIYTELLSWLFIQQEQFDKAFAQEKAIYKRSDQGLSRILNLAYISGQNEDYETAKNVLNYCIAESPSSDFSLQAKQLLLNFELKSAAPSHYAGIQEDFQQVLQEYGKGTHTFSLQIDYANFMAFKLKKPEQGLSVLAETSKSAASNYQKASVKMAMADILVLQEKFNQALIYYLQIQKLVKNDQFSQKARFKVAKTSYYKGDFKWAKSQLDVLKASTSQLIANDAMELSLLIEDNAAEDSTQAGLKEYARADFKEFQQENEAAIRILDSVLLQHKGESIEDEALFKQANLLEKGGEFKKAEQNYLEILAQHSEGILADNASFQLAELYANNLKNPEAAKQYYEKIIFNFADSIYFNEARKKYRALRGDDIE